MFESVLFHPVEHRVVVLEVSGLGLDSGAPCSKHARNLAVAACGHCGKFICELCKIDADKKTFCPGCFERLSSEGQLSSTVTRFRNYEGMALLCILISCLFWPLSVLAGPCGIYYCIRGLHDKKKRFETEGIASLWVRLVICSFMTLIWLPLIIAIFGGLR